MNPEKINEVLDAPEKATAAAFSLARQLAAARGDDDEWTRFPSPKARLTGFRLEPRENRPPHTRRQGPPEVNRDIGFLLRRRRAPDCAGHSPSIANTNLDRPAPLESTSGAFRPLLSRKI